VPQMILQPLVENAVQHGVAPLREGGWLEVAAGTNNGTLNIQVRNSAGGKRSNGNGVGLRNVETRLKYLYSGDASLHLAIAEDRTVTADLALPALNSQPDGMNGRRALAVPEANAPEAIPKAKDPLCAF
jgi:LytS/YehU family sensor histidine kinase